MEPTTPLEGALLFAGVLSAIILLGWLGSVVVEWFTGADWRMGALLITVGAGVGTFVVCTGILGGQG